MKILGIESTSFTSKDGVKISGKTFFVTEPLSPNKGEGSSAERFFMSAAKLAALDFTPAVGQEVTVLYNRFGKVAALSLVDSLIEVD